MKTSILHLDDKNTDKIIFSNYNPRGSTNSRSRQRMKEILAKAIVCELTDMQKLCFTEYYLQEKKQKDIASELGLNSSTVSRHISSARKKLKNIASYYSQFDII